MLSHPIGLVRLVGLLEGVSFILLLFIAMPLKYAAGKPAAVSVCGMAHGVLFIGYALVLVRAKFFADWNWWRPAKLMFAALLPFGPFLVDAGLKREQFKAENPPTS